MKNYKIQVNTKRLENDQVFRYLKKINIEFRKLRDMETTPDAKMTILAILIVFYIFYTKLVINPQMVKITHI